MIKKNVTLGEVCEVLDNLRKPITKKFRKKGKYPYYGATGIVDYVDNYIFDETLVLIGEDGAKWDKGEQTAFTASGKYWVNNHAHVVRPLKDKLNNKFLVYYLNLIDLKPWVTGLTVPKLNQQKLKSIPIPLFSLSEQKRIVAKLDGAFAEIDKIEISLKKNKNEIKNFFHSYILKFFKKNNTNKEIKPLKDLCENYRNDIVDGPFGSNLKSKDFTDKGIPVLKIQNVKEFLINNKKIAYISKTKFEELKRHTFKKGDIVMTKLGQPLGVSAIVKNLESGVIVADLVRIRANKINTEFLCFQLNSKENRRYINSMQKGTTRARIKLSVIRELPIYCPDKSQQEKILEKIKSFKSAINKLEKNYLLKENNLKSLKSSLLSNVLINNNAV